MIDDILYNIMLICPLVTLTKLMFVNRAVYALCQTPYFWQNRFRYHQLVLYSQPDTFREWVNDYILSDYAKHKMIKIINHTKHSYKWINSIILVTDETQTLWLLNYFIVTQHFDHINHLTNSFMYFNLHDARPNVLVYLHNHQQTIDHFTLYFTKQELMDHLQFIIYMIPDVKMTTSCGYDI